MPDAIQIVFVCLGNICRSPLAEAVFFEQVRRQREQFAPTIHIVSAATSSWTVGDPADPRSIHVALAKDYQHIRKHHARHLNVRLFVPHRSSDLNDSHSTHHYVICMDRQNVCDVQAFLKQQRLETSVQVHLFSDFGTEQGTEVPDPYYGDTSDFEGVLTQCERYAQELLTHLATTHLPSQ